MKVVCLLGSPRRKGNSATIAARFLETAISLGAVTQSYFLNELTYRGCQGCMSCKTRLRKCALKDDLSPVLDAAMEADMLVLATPVYYGDISCQLKGFIDRTYSWLAPDYLTGAKPGRLAPGKKLVFIFTQGTADEAMFADVYRRYSYFFKWYGYGDIECIRACGLFKPGEAGDRKEVMKLTVETARRMIKE